jgi:hypothetical protein
LFIYSFIIEHLKELWRITEGEWMLVVRNRAGKLHNILDVRTGWSYEPVRDWAKETRKAEEQRRKEVQERQAQEQREAESGKRIQHAEQRHREEQRAKGQIEVVLEMKGVEKKVRVSTTATQQELEQLLKGRFRPSEGFWPMAARDENRRWMNHKLRESWSYMLVEDEEEMRRAEREQDEERRHEEQRAQREQVSIVVIGNEISRGIKVPQRLSAETMRQLRAEHTGANEIRGELVMRGAVGIKQMGYRVCAGWSHALDEKPGGGQIRWKASEGTEIQIEIDGYAKTAAKARVDMTEREMWELIRVRLTPPRGIDYLKVYNETGALRNYGVRRGWC